MSKSAETNEKPCLFRRKASVGGSSASFLENWEGSEQTYVVYLPEDYAGSGRQYNTLYYLHGERERMARCMTRRPWA